MARRPPTRRPLLALVALLVVVALGYAVQAAVNHGSGSGSPAVSSTAGSRSGPRTVDQARLPAQARHTIALIDRGGPYPYSRDGIIFRNDERTLPAHEAGWYHEYTVPTPGESDRGARRIITGHDGSVFYTADHYASFVRVRGP